MTDIAQSTATRVVSCDGTQIAYRSTGEGPPLLLVHGATADHTDWNTVVPYLEPHVTVYLMDRRGRGGSRDAPVYAVEREFEDVQAVIDVAVAESGSPVDVLGHSFGGICAFGAAVKTSKIRRLVLYEGWPSREPNAFHLPPGAAQRMDSLIAEGKPEEALEYYAREVKRMSAEDLHASRTMPSWQARIGAVHTIVRESRGIPPLDPAQAARITVPVLLLVGSESPRSTREGSDAVAAALPNARVGVLEGQQDVAMDHIPEAFAERVLAFLRD